MKKYQVVIQVWEYDPKRGIFNTRTEWTPVGDAVELEIKTEKKAHWLCSLIHDIGQTIIGHE